MQSTSEPSGPGVQSDRASSNRYDLQLDPIEEKEWDAAGNLTQSEVARERVQSLLAQVDKAHDELAAARADRNRIMEEALLRERTLSAEVDSLRKQLDVANARLRVFRRLRAEMRRAQKALATIVSLPICWFEGFTEPTHRPGLTPARDLRPSTRSDFEWESTGNDPQFLIGRSLPRGWVRLRVRGRANPPASVTLYVGHDEVAEPGLALGLLTASGSTLEQVLDLSRVSSARLDPSLGPGHLTIEEFSIHRIGLWRAVLRVAINRLLRTRPRHPVDLLGGMVRLGRDPGLSGLKRAALSDLRQRTDMESRYETWLQHHAIDEVEVRRLRSAAASCTYQPIVSLLVEVTDPNPSLLARCVRSVRDQLYTRWELCLGYASAGKEVRSLLDAYSASDQRIKVAPLGGPHGVGSEGAGVLGIAGGEFLALLGQHDELSPDALLRGVLLLNQTPDADLIYTDEDEIDEAGHRANPYFKPAWSPETLLAQMYLGGLSIYRKSKVDSAGGVLDGTGRESAHDLALRITEITSRIHHIPRVVYHSRRSRKPASRATSLAGIETVQRALTRRGIAGTVAAAECLPNHYMVRMRPDRAQSVSIVIPTRDRADLLERCLESVFGLSSYPNFDVCVVDNGSKEQATADLLRRFEERWRSRFHVIRRDAPFNFSRLINAGVAETDGDLILLLNNDTEVIDGSWLDTMAGYAQHPEIGAVGCVLLYPNGSIQHGGVVLAAGGVAAHSHVGEQSTAPGYFGRLLAQSNYAAVTGACMMVRRQVFQELGGFDEQLAVAFNDVDFCLRALRGGYRNVCLGQVRLIHHESASRGSDEMPEKRDRALAEFGLMRERWAGILDRDPYYNPNLCSAPPSFAPLLG